MLVVAVFIALASQKFALAAAADDEREACRQKVAKVVESGEKAIKDMEKIMDEIRDEIVAANYGEDVEKIAKAGLIMARLNVDEDLTNLQENLGTLQDRFDEIPTEAIPVCSMTEQQLRQYEASLASFLADLKSQLETEMLVNFPKRVDNDYREKARRVNKKFDELKSQLETNYDRLSASDKAAARDVYESKLNTLERERAIEMIYDQKYADSDFKNEELKRLVTDFE